ncbi:RHS repeat-associated core domain-containing protein [Microcella sp.]|uniref:RHS repeat-associated core domain-containing protein n=1 Tax=Microcella sp. TaxID=1913979 RepID=UPI00391B1CF7
MFNTTSPRNPQRGKRRRSTLAATAAILTLTLTLDPFALGSVAPVLADEGSPFGLQAREDAFDEFLESLGQEDTIPAVPLGGTAPTAPGSEPIEPPPAVTPTEDEELVVLTEPEEPAALAAAAGANASSVVLPQTTTPPPGGPVEAEVGGVSVTVEAVEQSTGPDAVLVRVAGEAETEAAGVQGILLDVTDASLTEPAESEVTLTVAYDTFAGLGGSDWASRLRFVWIPDCTEPTTECAPQVLPTVNNGEAQTITAVVPVDTAEPVEPASLASATVSASSASSMTLASGSTSGGSLAVSAGVSGAQGNWGATSLSPAATWGNSGNTGAFTWSMGLEVPSPASGPAPQLAVSYNSAASDGRLPTTNNQTGPIGEGFDLTTGFIERTYTPCMDDDTAPSNNEDRPSGDLCWGTENATMSFNGGASELIREGSTNRWHSKFSDGTKVERLTGASNGGEIGEYWKVTTTDGTQYFFGRGSVPNGPSNLNSAWTVPVFGNNSGERCYEPEADGGFAESMCTQVYRWNLEHVIDPLGNTMTYFYEKESNHYIYDVWGSGERPETERTAAYTAGGRLAKIEFGTRTDSTGQAPAKVEFSYGPRCITDLSNPSSFCSAAQTSVDDNHWPDTPIDVVCTAATDEDCSFTPAFFSRYRLATIKTHAFDGAAYQPVTSWKLGQTFRPQGAGTNLQFAVDPMLVLSSITETGHAGTTSTTDDIERPSIDFTYEFLRNRVEVPNDNQLPLPRPRLSSISTETGATVTVGYETECGINDGGVPGTSETALRDNDRLCYPVEWTPEGQENEIVDFFHKYVVKEIAESGAARTAEGDELITGSVNVVTAFDYLGGAAWAKPTSALVKPKEVTYSEFRGFAEVLTTVGAEGESRSSRTQYFRGLGTTVTLTAGPAGEVVTATDRLRFQGQVFSAVEYNGATPVSQVITVPGDPVIVATNNKDVNSTRIPSTTTHGFTFNAAGEVDFRTKSVTNSNAYAQLVSVNDLGDVAVSSDDVCTQVAYAHAGTSGVAAALAASFQVSLVESTKVTATDCDATGASTAAVISWDTAEYDAQGQTHLSRRLDPTDGVGQVLVKEVLAYDLRGRPTSLADALGNVSTMTYTQSSGGLVQSITSTTADPDGAGPAVPMTSTTTFNPLTGMVTSTTDANGRTTTGTYDALGRLVSVVFPQHVGLADPSLEYEYSVEKTGLNSVLTRSLGADGVTQHTSVTHYDGLLRPFQYQSESVNAGVNRDDSASERGQLVAHVFYDSAGRIKGQTSPWHATGVPSMTPIETPGGVGSQTTFEYDAAGRQIGQVFWIGNPTVPENEQWRSVTHYDGARTLQIPPMGATPQMAIMDGRGRTIELRQYVRDADQAADADTPAEVLALQHQSTTYEFDSAGQMVEMRDAENNLWSYEFDFAGRQTSATDPDGGTTTTTYDALNRAVTRTNGNGQTVAYTYDALGRTLTLRDGSPTGAVRAQWQYDTALDENGDSVLGAQASSTRFVDGNPYTSSVDVYDDAYRPLSTTMTLPEIAPYTDMLESLSFTTEYTYTADGQVATVKHPGITDSTGAIALGSEVVTTQFDTASIPAWMGGGFGWGVYVADSGFEADGRLQALDLGNTYAARVGYSYEAETKRLAGISLQREQQATDLDLRYAYDDAGNVISIKDQSGSSSALHDNQCFGYDGLQRLSVAWTAGDGNCATDQEAITAGDVGGVSPYWTEYTYDPLGNRTSMVQHGVGADATITTTYTHGAATAGPHQLTSMVEAVAGGSSTMTEFAYDEAGNRVSSSSGGVTQGFVWDVEGELSAAGGEEYAYDASGNRMLRDSAAGLTVYLPGGQELLIAGTTEEPELSATRHYSFAGRIVAMRNSGGLGAVTSFVADHQGTLVAAVPNTNWAATAVERIYTDPFGGTRGASDDLPGDRGFLGAVEDNTGLTLLGARYYDSEVGSFISVDPLLSPGVPAQFNAYVYSANNPVTWSDPSGLFWGNLWAGVQSAWKKTTNLIKSAWNATASFVDRYKAEIAGVVVGLAVGIGCTVATAGAGVVACAIAGGAAGAAVTNVIKQSESGKPFDVGSFLFDTTVGGALGAVGGAAGPLLSSAIRSITTSGAGASAITAVRTGISNVLNRTPSFRPAPAPVRPQVAPGGGAVRPGVASSTATLQEAGETLYRGVPFGHAGYDDAVHGVARPRGGHADPALHNGGDTNSQFTSWTTSRSIAEEIANEGNGPGVLLELDPVAIDPRRLLASPDIYDEAEVLIRGLVDGAKAELGPFR